MKKESTFFKYVRHMLLPGLFWGLLSPGVQAQSGMVSLVPAQDNTLYEDTNGSLSNGSGDYLFAGKTKNNAIRRALVRFSLDDSIPAGVQIDSVKLMLTMSKSVSGAAPVTLHRVSTSWGEGASDADNEEGFGSTAQQDDATWIHRFSGGQMWNTAGGDFLATASDTALVDGNGPYTWEGPGLVADVNAWLEQPDANFGWILIGDESQIPSAKRFNSRENASGGPRLEIYYSQPQVVTALVQVIHNSPDPVADTVDIYIDGTRAINDLAFRTATPFLPLPAEQELTIGIAPGNSSDAAEIIASFALTLAGNETYAVIATGVIDTTMFNQQVNGNTSFGLTVISGALPIATNPLVVDIAAFHGAPDAPAVDVVVQGLNLTLFDSLHYGDFLPYASVPATFTGAPLQLNVLNDATGDLLATYEVTLDSLVGRSAIVFASGFLNPTENQDGAPFGFFAALGDGQVIEIPQLSTSRRSGLEALAGFMAYPNPTTGNIRLHAVSETSSPITLRVFDLMGRTLLEEKWVQIKGPWEKNLDLAAFAMRQVWVELRQGNQHGIARILVK